MCGWRDRCIDRSSLPELSWQKRFSDLPMHQPHAPHCTLPCLSLFLPLSLSVMSSSDSRSLTLIGDYLEIESRSKSELKEILTELNGNVQKKSGTQTRETHTYIYTHNDHTHKPYRQRKASGPGDEGVGTSHPIIRTDMNLLSMPQSSTLH